MSLFAIFEWLDKYLFVIELAYTIGGAFAGFLIFKFATWNKQRKIRKCLSLTPKMECKITLPSYSKKLYNQIEDISVCPIGDINAASNVIDLIQATGLYTHQHSLFYEESYSVPLHNYNVFCIGGFLANKYTFDYFKTHFPSFKVVASAEHIRKNPNKIPDSYFIEDDDYDGFSWGDLPTQRFYVKRGEERYAVLIKMTSKDFDIPNHGTVHILFGNGIEGTLTISNFLLHNYEYLFKQTKQLHHYFIAFTLHKDSKMIKKGSFRDLTEEMFPPK